MCNAYLQSRETRSIKSCLMWVAFAGSMNLGVGVADLYLASINAPVRHLHAIQLVAKMGGDHT